MSVISLLTLKIITRSPRLGIQLALSLGTGKLQRRDTTFSSLFLVSRAQGTAILSKISAVAFDKVHVQDDKAKIQTSQNADRSLIGQFAGTFGPLVFLSGVQKYIHANVSSIRDPDHGIPRKLSIRIPKQ